MCYNKIHNIMVLIMVLLDSIIDATIWRKQYEIRGFFM